MPADAVAVKSSELDELRGKDLLSELSPVRWIITKAALMEGWDCPFAYVLVMLDNTQAQRALTPTSRASYAAASRPTNRKGRARPVLRLLLQHRRRSSGSAGQERIGARGLTGLGDAVLSDSAEFQRIPFRRREAFRHKDIFLPLVLHKDGSAWDELDYQRHISQASSGLPLSPLTHRAVFPNAQDGNGRPSTLGRRCPSSTRTGNCTLTRPSDYRGTLDAWADLIPNPWQASRISRQFVDKLRAAGQSDDDIHDRRSYLAFALREHVTRSVETQAEAVFKHKLGAGDIRFDLQAGQPNFRMVDTYELPAAGGLGGLLARRDHQPMQISLFEPVFERQFDNELERNFARYLDEQKALQWWHRVAVRQSGDYYLRGWKQDRIWPDFVAMSVETAGKSHVLVFETKGDHLRGNPDTDYKQRVMETLEDAFNCGTMTVRNGPARGTFRLVFNDAQFPEVLADVAANH